jgi:hypothetical protein
VSCSRGSSAYLAGVKMNDTEYDPSWITGKDLERQFSPEDAILEFSRLFKHEEKNDRAARLICTTPEFDDLAAEVGLGDHRAGVTDPDRRDQLRRRSTAWSPISTASPRTSSPTS